MAAPSPVVLDCAYLVMAIDVAFDHLQFGHAGGRRLLCLLDG